MSLVSLAKKANYGQEIEKMSAQTLDYILSMAKVFSRFDDIQLEIKEIGDFLDEDKKEINNYMMDCYRKLMYACLGAHDIPGVGGIPIEVWDEVGIDIRPILAAVGKYTYPEDSTSVIVIK